MHDTSPNVPYKNLYSKKKTKKEYVVLIIYVTPTLLISSCTREAVTDSGRVGYFISNKKLPFSMKWPYETTRHGIQLDACSQVLSKITHNEKYKDLSKHL